MKILFFTALMFCCAVFSSGQETEESEKRHLSLFLGGAVGNFKMKADDFTDMYSNRSISRIYVAGIGDGQAYLTGKYRQFYANGRSKTVNVGAEGKSEWKQKFYMIGPRLMTKASLFYFELLYVMTEAEEKITTVNPEVSQLISQSSTKAQGFAFSLGLAINFPPPFRIFGEVEYSTMLKLGQNSSGRDIPQIGGICLSGGVILVL